MMRLLGYLLALALLPVFVSPSASATCEYTGGCEAPHVRLSVPSTVTQGTRPVIRFQVVAFSGNAEPVGKVVVGVKRRGGGFRWTATRSVSELVTRTVRLTRLTKRGRYLVTARFVPKPDTIWKATVSTKSFKVERKR